MLLLLLYMCGIILLTGAFPCISENTRLHFPSCPITYYAKEYSEIYVDFTESSFIICFTNYYDPEMENNCIHFPSVTMNQIFFFINNYINDPIFDEFQGKLPTFKGTIKCHLTFDSFGQDLIYLLSLEAETILIWKHQNRSKFLKLEVDGKTVDEFKTQYRGYELLAIGGCKVSGMNLRPGEKVQVDLCTTVTCSSSSDVHYITCDEDEICSEYGICLEKPCSVIGPAVIDFHGGVSSVSDRCVYNLLSDKSVGLEIKASFKERRRRDVTFLDSVTVDLRDRLRIQLKQGGRVLVNNSLVTINNSVFNGVDISTALNRVTVSFFLDSNTFLTMTFDSNTAQVYMNDFSGSDDGMNGLCQDSSSSDSSRSPEDPSCQDMLEDPEGIDIDPSAVMQQCNALKRAPFSFCKDAVDPEPYVTACTNTLSKYPDVDGLWCQFVEAYIKICRSINQPGLESLQADIDCDLYPDNLVTFPDYLDQMWPTVRKPANRDMREVICAEICSDHEFCGEIHDDTGCRCRAVTPHEQNQLGRLGDLPVCSECSVSLTLMGCLFVEKGIDYSVLHLNDPNCKGKIEEETHMVTFSYERNSCGSQVTTNNSHTVYRNTIRSSPSNPHIQRDVVNIVFSCTYRTTQSNEIVLKSTSNTIYKDIESGQWSYSVTMRAFVDRELTKPLESASKVKLNQRIWVVAFTHGLDENVVTFITETCWATKHKERDSEPRHDLIIDGCPNYSDGTVFIVGNGLRNFNYFSFKMFEFNEANGKFFLHCEFQLCDKLFASCAPVCSNGYTKKQRLGRRQRVSVADSLNISYSNETDKQTSSTT